MGSTAQLLSSVIAGLQDIQTIRYTRLGSTAIVIFDHLITLDQEVHLIWKKRLSFITVLFFLNRYYTLATAILATYAFFASNLTDSFCLRFFQWQGWTGLIGCMLAEAILQVRIYALYSMSKSVLLLMVAAFLTSCATSAWIMGTALSEITAHSVQIPGGEFCDLPIIPDRIYTFWIPKLTFESVLCTLALIRGFQSFKAHGSLFDRSCHLFHILVRDSVLYFFVIAGIYLTCMIFWIKEQNALFQAPVGFSLVMSCSLASRMILNIREEADVLDYPPSESSQV